jgi:hypothetical protein
MEHENQIDAQHDTTRAVLPANYAAPEVHELGNCSELTLGGGYLFFEDDGRWC